MKRFVWLLNVVLAFGLFGNGCKEIASSKQQLSLTCSPAPQNSRKLVIEFSGSPNHFWSLFWDESVTEDKQGAILPFSGEVKLSLPTPHRVDPLTLMCGKVTEKLDGNGKATIEFPLSDLAEKTIYFQAISTSADTDLKDVKVSNVYTVTVPSFPQGQENVEVRLEWETTADLDLQVTDPHGDQVSIEQPTVPSGGTLMWDANCPCQEAIIGFVPTEIIYWPQGGAPSGDYWVIVKHFDKCYDEDKVKFTLDVEVDGNSIYTESHTLEANGIFEYCFTRW